MIAPWSAERIAAWCRLDDGGDGAAFRKNTARMRAVADDAVVRAWRKARMAFRAELVRLAPEAVDYQVLERRVFGVLPTLKFPVLAPPSSEIARAAVAEGLRHLWSAVIARRANFT